MNEEERIVRDFLSFCKVHDAILSDASDAWQMDADEEWLIRQWLRSRARIDASSG